MMEREWDSESVTCPSCGEDQGDCWDYDWGNEDSLEVACGYCTEKYQLWRSVSVKYAATPIQKKST